MKKRSRVLGALLAHLTALTVWLTPASAQSSGSAAVGPVHDGDSAKGEQWVPATLFPPGAMLAVLSGNPAQSGESTAELSLPDGYRVPRHYHPMGERLEVRQGTLLVLSGERFDATTVDTLHTGDTTFTPAGVHHIWVARGATVVALTFDGPFTITYVNAYEAPRGTSFPLQY